MLNFQTQTQTNRTRPLAHSQTADLHVYLVLSFAMVSLPRIEYSSLLVVYSQPNLPSEEFYSWLVSLIICFYELAGVGQGNPVLFAW